MNISDGRLREIARLLDEIDRETRNGCRPLRISNLARRIRLEIKKSERSSNGKETSSRDRACG